MLTSLISNHNFMVLCVIFSSLFDFYTSKIFTHWTWTQSSKLFVLTLVLLASRKAVATTWTCWWWPWCWQCAPSWGCRGSWLPPCSPSHMSTAWRWRQRAQHLASSLTSWVFGSRESLASWSSPWWAAPSSLPLSWRSVSSPLLSPLPSPTLSLPLPISLSLSALSLCPSPSLSFSLSSSLQLIPMPVLYGVFLFMGVSSLDGIQVCFWSVLGSAPLPHLTMSMCSSLTESSCWPCHPNTSRTWSTCATSRCGRFTSLPPCSCCACWRCGASRPQPPLSSSLWWWKSCSWLTAFLHSLMNKWIHLWIYLNIFWMMYVIQIQ